jgi:hypothetical protein
MTQPMMKILLTLAMMTGAASTQSRAFYDAGGKHIGSATTDSGGTVTDFFGALIFSFYLLNFICSWGFGGWRSSALIGLRAPSRDSFERLI